MDRPRRISIALLNCPELRDVSAEAEVLGHRLSLACDDFGRARLDGDVFTKKLFPRHPEARGVIDHWCKELEKSGYIERYRVGTGDYIRLRRWAEDQDIKDPRPSDLPPSPTEPPDSRIAEKVKTPQEAGPVLDEPPPSPSPLLPDREPPKAAIAAVAASVVEQAEPEAESVELQLARLHGVAPRRSRHRPTAGTARQ